MSSHQNARQNRRKFSSLLIEPFKQVKFGLVLLGASTIFLIILGYFILESFNAQYTQLMELYNVTDEGAKYELITNELFKRHMIQFALLYLAYFLAFLLLIIKLTHRFYGPSVAFRRFVLQMR